MSIDYSTPVSGYNPLRFNPQMSYEGMVNPTQSNFNIPPNGQTPTNNQGSQSQYTMQPSWQFGLNWNQIALSNSIKGIGAFLRSNNERNDFKNYNRVQQNPLSQLPENGNTSAQALYGMKQFKKGGYKYPDGGNTGNPYTASNILRSKGPDADNANLLERINYVLASGNPAKGDITSGYNADQKSLLTSAYIWKQQNPGRPVDELINGYFRQPVSQGNSADALRQKLNNIGYGPMSMYTSTEDTELQARQGNNMGIAAKKQGGKVKMAEGGRFDNMDDFDEDDFDDLKDELDNYFKQQESVVSDKKEEQPEEKQGDKEDEQSENQDQPSHEALDFLNTPQSTDEESKQDEGHDKNLMDQLAGIAPIPKPESETPHPSVYATQPTDDVNAFKSGIARVENAGYTEGNKNSSAFGKYQFTAPTRENVREQFFPSIAKKDFETSYKEDPKFQERVMDVYSSHLLQQFGDPHKAALAFYLGPGKANYTNQLDYNPGGGNVSVGNYLNTFDKGYGKKQGGHIGIKPETIQTNFPDGGQISTTGVSHPPLPKMFSRTSDGSPVRPSYEFLPNGSNGNDSTQYSQGFYNSLQRMNNRQLKPMSDPTFLWTDFNSSLGNVKNPGVDVPGKSNIYNSGEREAYMNMPQGSFTTKKKGGNIFKEGGEYELTELQAQQLMRSGYKIEKI